MSDLSKLSQFNNLANQLIEKASKDDIAECASILAMNVAHYKAKYGDLPVDEQIAMIGMTKANDEQIKLTTDGLEILVGVLGNVVLGVGQERH